MYTQKPFKVDFIGIGDQKSASSWIFKCLSEHPEVCVSNIKETRFFDQDALYKKGISHYQSRFSRCSDTAVRGEFSPSYIHSVEAPERIHKHFPNAKLITCFRNPVDKAYSGYWFNKIGGSGSMTVYDSFEEALEGSEGLIQDNFHHKHLQRFLEYFPRNQILVLVYDDIAKDPHAFIRNVYEFVGIDAAFVPPSLAAKVNATGDARLKYPMLFYVVMRIYNVIKHTPVLYKLLQKINKKRIKRALMHFGIRRGGKTFIKPPMREETRKKLTDIYRDDIQQLEAFLGRKLNWV